VFYSAASSLWADGFRLGRRTKLTPAIGSKSTKVALQVSDVKMISKHCGSESNAGRSV
jgi:hypothetical protein